MPYPEREYAQVGDSPLDVQAGPWTAKASEIAVVRLLNDFAQRPAGQFDRYLEQTGLVEIPG